MLDTSNQRLIKDYEFFWLVYNCPIPGSPRRTAHLPSLKYMTSLEETRTGYPAKCTANRTAKPNKGHLQKTSLDIVFFSFKILDEVFNYFGFLAAWFRFIFVFRFGSVPILFRFLITKLSLTWAPAKTKKQGSALITGCDEKKRSLTPMLVSFLRETLVPLN